MRYTLTGFGTIWIRWTVQYPLTGQRLIEYLIRVEKAVVDTYLLQERLDEIVESDCFPKGILDNFVQSGRVCRLREMLKGSIRNERALLRNRVLRIQRLWKIIEDEDIEDALFCDEEYALEELGRKEWEEEEERREEQEMQRAMRRAHYDDPLPRWDDDMEDYL